MLSYRNTFKRISSDSEEDSDHKEKFATIVTLKRKESVANDMEIEKPKQEAAQCNSVVKKRKVNNIWSSVMSENLLTDDLGQCQLRMEGKYHKDRAVENYDYTRKALDTRPDVPEQELNPELNSTEISITDLEPKIGLNLSEEPSKFPVKKKFKMSCKKNEATKVAKEIASKLKEPKQDIIYRAVRALGKQKMLEFLHMVEDIEENGGMNIVNGSRRRTPGGVLFYLLKRASIGEPLKYFIFEEDKQHHSAIKQQKKAHKKMQDKFKRKMEFHRKKGELESKEQSSTELPPLPTQLELLNSREGLSESTSTESSMEATEQPTNLETTSTVVKRNPDSEPEEGEILD